MKEKGFDKPIKYIFIGQPNTSKTTLAKKAKLKVFETDSLTEEQVLDIKSYPQNTDVIIVGGKWIKHQLQILSILSKEFKNFQLIQVRFMTSISNTLKFFIENSDYEDSYMMYIATTDKILEVFLNDDDGYRSHADVVPEEEVDGFKFWLKMEGGKQKVFEIEYDEASYDFKEGDSDIIIRAKFLGKIIFEVGTDNADDYYPNYYVKYEEKGLDELLKESRIDEQEGIE